MVIPAKTLWDGDPSKGRRGGLAEPELEKGIMGDEVVLVSLMEGS